MKDKSLSALYKERENLCKKLAKFKEIIRGSVVILRKPCTYPILPAKSAKVEKNILCLIFLKVKMEKQILFIFPSI